MHHCRQFNMYSDNNFLGMVCKFVFVNLVRNPLFLRSINIELFAKHVQIVRLASPLNTDQFELQPLFIIVIIV